MADDRDAPLDLSGFACRNKSGSTTIVTSDAAGHHTATGETIAEATVEEDIDGDSLVGMKVALQHPTEEPEEKLWDGVITSFCTEGEQNTWTIKFDNSDFEKKEVNLNFETTARAVTTRKRADIELVAMNAEGVLKKMTCTRAEPVDYPKGRTPEDRGATRYLGVYFSFAGWQEQQRQVEKNAQNLTRAIARTAPNLRQLESILATLLVPRTIYARHVMPAARESTDKLRKHAIRAVHQVLGLHYAGDRQVEATLFTPPEMGLGLGIADPFVASTIQDARRMFDGTETKNDKLAAATWAALNRGIDKSGCKTEGSKSTSVSRAENLASIGIWLHRSPTGRTRAAPLAAIQAPRAPTQDLVPEEALKRFKHEIDIALVPPDKVIFVPAGGTWEEWRATTETPSGSAPSTTTETAEHRSLVGSSDLLSAVGMAKAGELGSVWAIKMDQTWRQAEAEPESEIGTTDGQTRVLNMRFKEDRSKAGLEHGSSRDQKAALREEVWITGALPTLVVEQPLSVRSLIWDETAKDFRKVTHFEPSSRTKEAKTLATTVRNTLKTESLEKVATFAVTVNTELRAQPGKLWESPTRYMAFTDASVQNNLPLSTKSQRHQVAQCTRGDGEVRPRPTAGEIARGLEDERRVIEEKIKSGSTAYFWVLFTTGYDRNSGIGEKALYRRHIAPSWRLAQGFKHSSGVVRWAELVDPAQLEDVGKNDITPGDIERWKTKSEAGETSKSVGFVGREILKDFTVGDGPKIFKGTVMTADGGGNHVEYDDGDTETLSDTDMEEYLIPLGEEGGSTASDILKRPLSSLEPEFKGRKEEEEGDISWQKFLCTDLVYVNAVEQHNRAAWDPANQQGAHTIGDLTMPPEVGDFSNILLGMIETTAHWLQDTPSIEAESLLAPAGLSLKHLGIDPAIKEPHGIKGRLGKDPNYVGRLMFETSQTLAAFLREHDGPRGPGEEASRQKKVACACLRASPAEGEAACRKDTTAGLNGATYSAATWDEHCGEAEQAPSESDEESRDEIRGCTCLKEFPTRAERDRHIIETLEAGCHAITPDELPAMGGAYAWVDMWTGTALQCRAFQIHNEGKEESSTRGEAMTINQATTGLVELIGSGQLAAEDMTTVTISTDSEASVAATKSQVIKAMKTQQQSKSALATPMRNLTAIARHLKSLGVNINVIHNYNEHGRGWDNEDRGSMTCRGNKACDEAAGAAAKASIGTRAKMDHRAQPLDGGGATYLSTAAGKIEGDVKPVVKQLVGPE